MSQDCDLDWDYQARFPRDGQEPPKGKDLPSVLFCETRILPDGLRLPDFNGDIWKRIRQNQDERYHLLTAVSVDQDRAGDGIPVLLLDFKRYFTIPTGEIYLRLTFDPNDPEAIVRRTLIESPWREDLSARFFNFQSRVALPDAKSEA